MNYAQSGTVPIHNRTLEDETKRAACRILYQKHLQLQARLKEKLGSLPLPEYPESFAFLDYDFIKLPDGRRLPVRYKVPKGGRGKGASWNIGRHLLKKCLFQKRLVLCTREVQNSIKDSVHRLLKTQIKRLGYSEFFVVTANSIRCLVTDSEFIFRGLNDMTAENVKSMEGITDVWVAEAESMGARSWMILDPTIREEGSQIYVDYNPDNPKSATNTMFTTDCPPDAIVVHLTYRDNPHFPSTLETLRQNALLKIQNAMNEEQRLQAQLDYNHVWEGHCRAVSKASIFGAHHIVEAFTPQVDPGEWSGPYDGADWGFSVDPTVRVRVWVHELTLADGRVQRRLCVEREAYMVGCEIRHLQHLFDGKVQKSGEEWVEGPHGLWPNSRDTKIRGDSAQPATISSVANDGFDIVGVEKWKGSVEDGIEHMRGHYDIIVVHPRCTHTAEEMVLYSYKLDKHTDEPTTDIVDKFNHCIDAIRYALELVITHKNGGYLFA